MNSKASWSFRIVCRAEEHPQKTKTLEVDPKASAFSPRTNPPAISCDSFRWRVYDSALLLMQFLCQLRVFPLVAIGTLAGYFAAGLVFHCLILRKRMPIRWVS